MYCTNCGNVIDDNSIVCPYCHLQQVPLNDIQLQSTSYNNPNSQKLTQLGKKIGKIIGKGLNVSISVGTDIGKGIKQGIQNEMNNKK